ncbi:acetylornithine deacetylase/succinyl-diaminopimelate desuccinylase [Brockia lithotrophica]|uniref:Acetylornithine deacetylase/succinyl-diaminopimelate desuccinylase n=2 Tax=Brockia lithotrophica TaxID=933949 RepID=A0A660KV22_9BACL|nr:acetylornithine deacetylase/succinyl-diaminopimelate desuccinylase [Brockia lithotrophica]
MSMLASFLLTLQEAACRDPARGAVSPLQAALIAARLPLEVLELGGFPALLVPLHPQPRGLLSVHYDVVPCDVQGPPATPAADETRVLGRGSSDVLGAAAALVLALRDARERWSSPPPLWVAFVGDEEYGGTGSRLLAERLPSTVRWSLVLEPTEEAFAFASAGSLEVHIDVQGRASHGSTPEAGVNAVREAVYILERLEGAVAELARHEDPTRNPVLTPLMLAGGSDELVIPETARLVVDIRIPPGSSPQEIQKAVEAALATYGGPAHLKTAFLDDCAGAWEVDPEAEVGPLLRRLYREAAGREPSLGFMPSWTDAHAYHARGLYPVVWGPGRLDVAHTAREFVQRDALERAYRFLLAVLSHSWD